MKALLQALRRCSRRLEERPLSCLLLTALVLDCAVEALHRHSVLKMFRFIGTNPYAFCFGGLILFLTLCPSLFFRRRAFARGMLSLVWLGLGVVDCIILYNRSTPLTMVDFQLLGSVWPVLEVYLRPWQMVLAGVAAALLIALIVLWALRADKQPRLAREGLFALLISALLLWGGWHLGLETEKLSDVYPNLPDAFRSYGFVTCFSSSAVGQGIDQPEDYSQASVQSILQEIHVSGQESEPALKPNILFVQLESFIDVGRLRNVQTDKDPTPVFNGLKKTCSTGLLTVPSIGAGTANTEFEVLTGMDRLYFGTGEYPYKTVLQDHTCESLCYVLRELGYQSHAVHNHYGTFYDRDLVYSHLGFNTFTSLEYMGPTGKTPRGWALDETLTDYVEQAMDSTPGVDFVYTVTVQGHGKYASDGEAELPFTAVTDEEVSAEWSYYMTQIHGTDQFVGDLIEALEAREEPCVLVLFGDHIPSLGIEDEDLNFGTTLQTEYVIWSNFGLEKQDRNLFSWQLGSWVLERLGIENGVMNKLHQRYRDNPNYREALETLEYDLLYGDQTAYGGSVPEPTVLHMGIGEIELSHVAVQARRLTVTGRGFTPWSTVLVDGKPQETRYLNQGTLLVTEFDQEEPFTVTVAQMGKDKAILSETAEYRCGEEN